MRASFFHRLDGMLFQDQYCSGWFVFGYLEILLCRRLKEADSTIFEVLAGLHMGALFKTFSEQLR